MEGQTLRACPMDFRIAWTRLSETWLAELQAWTTVRGRRCLHQSRNALTKEDASAEVTCGISRLSWDGFDDVLFQLLILKIHLAWNIFVHDIYWIFLGANQKEIFTFCEVKCFKWCKKEIFLPEEFEFLTFVLKDNEVRLQNCNSSENRSCSFHTVWLRKDWFCMFCLS